MSEHADPDFLKNEAYDDADDLSIRIRIQEQYGTHPQGWYTWVFDRLRLPLQYQVLELGCGPGNLWLENTYRISGSWQMALSDLSEGMLREARRSLLNQGQFCFIAVDAQAIPFQDELFDAVIGLGLMDHVPKRRKALAEVHRVLKPGGTFYISAGGRTHLAEIEDLVKPFLPDANYGGDPERFGLENGTHLLSHWFSKIEEYHYAEQMIFASPDPVLAYVLSEPQVRKALTGNKRLAFRQELVRRLSSEGKITVTSDKGLFEARKSEIR